MDRTDAPVNPAAPAPPLPRRPRGLALLGVAPDRAERLHDAAFLAEAHGDHAAADQLRHAARNGGAA